MTPQRLIPRHHQFRLHHGLRSIREHFQQHAATTVHFFPAMSQLHHRIAFALQTKRQPVRPRADLQPRRAVEGLPFRIRKRQPLDHHALKKAPDLHEAHRLLPLVLRLRVPVANVAPPFRDHHTLPLTLHRSHTSRVEKHRLLPKLKTKDLLLRPLRTRKHRRRPIQPPKPRLILHPRHPINWRRISGERERGENDKQDKNEGLHEGTPVCIKTKHPPPDSGLFHQWKTNVQP